MKSPTLLGNSRVGDHRPNRVPDRAVQAVGEQIRVVRRELQQRLGERLRGAHPVSALIDEHAVGCLSKRSSKKMGDSRDSASRREKCHHETGESGKKVHHWISKRGSWKCIGAKNSSWRITVGRVELPYKQRVACFGLVGTHRRWDRRRCGRILGSESPDGPEERCELKARWLAEEENADGVATGTEQCTKMSAKSLESRFCDACIL